MKINLKFILNKFIITRFLKYFFYCWIIYILCIISFYILFYFNFKIYVYSFCFSYLLAGLIFFCYLLRKLIKLYGEIDDFIFWACHIVFLYNFYLAFFYIWDIIHGYMLLIYAFLQFDINFYIQELKIYFLIYQFFIIDHTLYFILNVFFLGILYLLFFCNYFNLVKIRLFTTIFFNLIFLLFLMIYVYLIYNLDFNYYLFSNFFYVNLFNIGCIVGLDNISLLFIVLTCFLFCIVNLISLYNITYKYYLFCLNLIVLELLVILTFLSINLFFFYIFFEASLIPMFLMIGMWGSRQRKLYAVYQFFFYTILGSIFLLSGIFILYSTFKTLDIRILSHSLLPYDRQLIVWLLLFVGFSTKIPLVPFHVWLPEAHVEAPTAGSIILAGILLKIGTYGILRFMLPIFYFANHFYSLYVYTLCLLSILYISFIILTQIDLKKIIAYSSILHMNFIVLGLFSFTLVGVSGAVFLMISHGLISSGLFICIGILYDRYKTRNILYYGGLVNFMPLFSIFFFLILANMGFPLTSNFIGECLINFSIIENNIFLVIIMLGSTFFSATYSIWLFNRIVFGVNLYLHEVSDLTEREFTIIILLVSAIFLFGIQPNLILNTIEFQILSLLEELNY